MTKRVLVVEDTPIVREVLITHLHKLDINCYSVETGEEAVELAQFFDLILMDVNLPGISGLEAARRIRQRELDANIEPVVILANTNGSNRNECLAAGMDDFCSKAITLDAVRDLVDRWLTASPSKFRLLG